MSHHILICDDEKDIVNALKIYLSSEDYTLHTAYNGKEALQIIRTEPIDLLLLDIMMPEMDGIETMRRLREQYKLPVILLTAKSEDTDKILGLNLGADDYITKPFNPMEVLARVRSQLRRYTQLGSAAQVSSSAVFRIGNIVLNDTEKSVTVDGDPVSLTPTEYAILLFLLKSPNRVFSPQEIYTAVRGELPYGAEGTIAVHIRHLREKIEINPAEPRFLKAVWGQGYKLEG